MPLYVTLLHPCNMLKLHFCIYKGFVNGLHFLAQNVDHNIHMHVVHLDPGKKKKNNGDFQSFLNQSLFSKVCWRMFIYTCSYLTLVQSKVERH